jgi:hypothetical protein
VWMNPLHAVKSTLAKNQLHKCSVLPMGQFVSKNSILGFYSFTTISSKQNLSGILPPKTDTIFSSSGLKFLDSWQALLFTFLTQFLMYELTETLQSFPKKILEYLLFSAIFSQHNLFLLCGSLQFILRPPLDTKLLRYVVTVGHLSFITGPFLAPNHTVSRAHLYFPNWM